MDLKQAYEIKELINSYEKAESLAVKFQDMTSSGHEYIEINTKYGSLKFKEDDDIGNSVAFHLDVLFGDKAYDIQKKIENYEENKSQ